MLWKDSPNSLEWLPLCNRDEFVLDRVVGKDVLSIGLGGQHTSVDYSFDVTGGNLGWTFSAQVAATAGQTSFADISDLAIEAFRKEVDADYFHADICAPPQTWPSELLSRRFDVIILGEVLEHLDSPGPALRSLRGLLAPGGTILITVPNTFNLSVFARMARGHENVHPEHVAYYSPTTLCRLAEMSGLRVTEIGFYRTRPLRLRQLIDNPLGYLSGLVAERIPQYGRGIVAIAQPRDSNRSQS